MKKTLITRQPRSIRYMIFVNGQHEQSDGRRKDAFKRAAIIRQTWKSAQTIEVIDTWAWRTGEQRFSF